MKYYGVLVENDGVLISKAFGCEEDYVIKSTRLFYIKEDVLYPEERKKLQGRVTILEMDKKRTNSGITKIYEFNSLEEALESQEFKDLVNEYIKIKTKELNLI